MAFTGNGHELEQDTLINRFNRLEKLVHNNLYIKCPVCNGYPSDGMTCCRSCKGEKYIRVEVKKEK